MKLAKLSSDLHEVVERLQIGDEFLWEPLRIARPGAWIGHLATAFWLIKAVRPRTFVELGTHSGNSYSAFCQAISRFGLPSRAFAVDTWLGDEHSGFYDDSVFQDLNSFNQDHFSGFSRLVRSTFDEARSYFADGSVDLLHIDGLHTYEAVKHDFETWKTAASSSAVVVFHDINVREQGFGVWRLWRELSASYPSFEFIHSEGLGILGLGQNQSPELTRLFEISQDTPAVQTVRQLFAARGEAFLSRARYLDLEDLTHRQVASLHESMNDLNAELARLREVEVTAQEQAANMAKLAKDAETAHNAYSELQAAVPPLQTELERLRKVEEFAREQVLIYADELCALRSQLAATMALNRQQSLTSQRSMMELLGVRQELDRYKSEYQQAARLLIPLRVRRALPDPLKNPLRAINRAVRSLMRRAS